MPDLSLSNLLQTQPSTYFQYTSFAIAFIVIMFFGSFILNYLRKKHIQDPVLKKTVRAIPKCMRWVSLIALILTLSRLEGVPYLSMRIWWIVLLLGMITFEIINWRKYFIRTKQKEKYAGKIDENNEKTKYIPKKKRKKSKS